MLMFAIIFGLRFQQDSIFSTGSYEYIEVVVYEYVDVVCYLLG